MRKSNSFLAAFVLLIVVVLAVAVLINAGKGADILPDELPGDLPSDGTQTPDTLECKHTNTTQKAVNSGNNLTHDVVKTCSDCGSELGKTTVSHSFKNSLCSCGYVCSHGSSLSTNYLPQTANQHAKFEQCSACDYTNTTYANHIMNNGVCSVCKYSCYHVNVTTAYSNPTATGHTVKETCGDCGALVKNTVVAHTMSNGVCSACKYSAAASCQHSYTFGYSYVNDNQHQETQTCRLCGDVQLGDYLSHYPSTQYVLGTATASGHTEQYLCNRCGHVWSTTVVPHNFVNGVCNMCDYSDPNTSACAHLQTENVYVQKDGAQHTVNNVCSACGTVVSSTTESHIHTNADTCVCGIALVHAMVDVGYVYVDETHHGDKLVCEDCDRTDVGNLYPHAMRDEYILGTATATGHTTKNNCPYCGYSEEAVTSAHTFENGECTVCGYEQTQ